MIVPRAVAGLLALLLLAGAGCGGRRAPAWRPAAQALCAATRAEAERAARGAGSAGLADATEALARGSRALRRVDGAPPALAALADAAGARAAALGRWARSGSRPALRRAQRLDRLVRDEAGRLDLPACAT